MGRKRQSAKNNRNNDDDNAQERTSLEDRCIQLLKDLHALYPQSQKEEEEEEGKDLIKAMQQLANALNTTIDDNHPNDDIHKNKLHSSSSKDKNKKQQVLEKEQQIINKEYAQLEKIESSSFLLRQAAHYHTLILLPQLRHEALSLYTQLNNLLSSNQKKKKVDDGACAVRAAVWIGRALYHKLLVHWNYEEYIANSSVQRLELLYGKDDDDDVTKVYRQLSSWFILHIASLRQNAENHNNMWDVALEYTEQNIKETKNVVWEQSLHDQLNPKQDEDNDNNRADENSSIEREKNDSPLPQLISLPGEYIHSSYSSFYTRVQNCSTVWQVVQLFLSEKHQNNTPPSATTTATLNKLNTNAITHPTTIQTTSKQKVTSLLLIGPPGCGKTHLCDTIQQYVTSSMDWKEHSTKVIRPKLPMDFMRSTVGSSEDLILSMFAYIKKTANTNGQNCILILDGLEHLIGSPYSDDSNNENKDGTGGAGGGHEVIEESHLLLRMRCTFLSALDSLYCECSNDYSVSCMDDDAVTPTATTPTRGDILIICTARKNNGNGMTDRFDKVINMGPSPSESECRDMIASCLQPEETMRKETLMMNDRNISDERIKELLSNIAKCAAGKSTAEIAQACRGALISCPLKEEKKHKTGSLSSSSLYESRLHHLKQSLQTVVPGSIKNGSLDGVLDVTIYTSKELCSTLKYADDEQGGRLRRLPLLPLFGSDAINAWKEIETLIVTPLCRSKELDDILYGGDNCMFEQQSQQEQNKSGGKIVCAGALLTGPPGSGKTVLARHCAAVASTILPSVRLLDVSCTSLIHKEVGGSERAVQRLFAAARAAAPCIILLDGIEHIAPLRGHDHTTEGTMDRLLSTVLTEMDGIDDHPSPPPPFNSLSEEAGGGGRVAVIGITHNPKWIDPALRRPGRLEKCVVMNHPDVTTRQAIVFNEVQKLQIDLSSSTFFEPKDKKALAEFVALQTHGMSASEVIAVCTEACMICIREIAFQTMDKKEEENKNMEKSTRMDPVLAHRHFASALHFRKTGTSKF